MKKLSSRTLCIAALFSMGLGLAVGCAQVQTVATPNPTVDSATPIASPAPLPTAQVADDATLAESADAALSLPACAPSISEKVSLPDNFAPAFPFPHGILFSSVTVLNDNVNYLQVVGYAPLELDEADALVKTALPKAGYEIETEDAGQEQKDADAPADIKFSGNGYRGALRVASVSNCPAVTQWTIVVLKEGQ